MCYTLIVIGMRAFPNQNTAALRLMTRTLTDLITALVSVINPYHLGLSKARIAFNCLQVQQR